MEKNQLKMYDAPAVEVVELEVAQILCASPEGDSNIPTPGWGDVE